ncbi:MAG: putative glycoside hydrolase [Gaiellaceae bacterium]
MDAGQREELSHWAEALVQSSDRETVAAGRAIQSLCAKAATTDVERREHVRLASELRTAKSAELRAAGRAIGRLCDENVAAAPGKPVPRAARRTFHLPWRSLAIGGGALLILAGGAVVAARAAAPDLGATGPARDSLIGREGLAGLVFSARDADARWMLDGRPVQPVARDGRVEYRPSKLSEGRHTLVVSRPARFFGSARRVFSFTIDTAAPTVRLEGPAVVPRGMPLVVRGKLEPGSRLEGNRTPVTVESGGRFTLKEELPPRSFVLRATDAAGNSSRWRVPVTVVPRRPKEPIRSVHVTAYGWADATLRKGIMALVRAGKINAVQLDLKDESGEVGWASGVPLAKQLGAQLDIYDLPKALRQLHALGVRVIGRIVCFRDPIHAQAAWKAGRRAEVIQTPDGSPYAKYGGFTNFAHPAVRRYNVDLAVAAAKLGIDEILYDYVRRPDGPRSSMSFPGLQGTPEAAIASFLAESRAALSKTDVLIGASVFGVAATRPEEVGQDIPAMARHVDYIAPMLYPSHWGPGEYDVADPNGQPYEIVHRSTADFVKQVRGTGARVVNWLQDFSYGLEYGPDQVKAQIAASRDAGVDEFILWDAAVTYTDEALEPTAGVPAIGFSTSPPKSAPMPVRLPDAKPAVKAKRDATPRARPVPNTQPSPGLPPNELGQIPVVMHHMIRADRIGEYDQTPAEFRAELEYLWKNGYVPVNVGDLISGELDVPKGTTPVAFTFDDATTYQIAFTPEGEIEPSTAVGIMLEFARTHPGFVPRGTFYVNRTPFGSQSAAKQALPWLHENGFEIGNHTHSHVPLRTLPDEEVRRQLWTGEALIRKLLPGY